MPAPPACLLCVVSLSAQASSRHRKVTAWARETAASGLKVSAPVPLVMPLAAAHATAWD